MCRLGVRIPKTVGRGTAQHVCEDRHPLRRPRNQTGTSHLRHPIALLRTSFPQVAPGPILIEPRPGSGPARARSCAGSCPPPDPALREHDHAQVPALPRIRPCASTIMRRFLPSPGSGPARARSCAGSCPPPDPALREHDHAQVPALPRIRPCASTIMRRFLPSPGSGPARARSCAGSCPPPDPALREHDHAQVPALPRIRPGRRQPLRSPFDRAQAAAAGLHDVEVRSSLAAHSQRATAGRVGCDRSRGADSWRRVRGRHRQ